MKTIRRFVLAAALVACLPQLASGRPAARPPRLQNASGITPGGLLWHVDARASTLTLRRPTGDLAATFPVRAEERVVLGVEDDGARVTAATSIERGYGRPETPTRPVTFRDAAGNEMTRREIKFDAQNPPVVNGTVILFARREKGVLRLFRTTRAEDAAPAGTVRLEKILPEIGRLDALRLHATAAGLVVEARGVYRSIYVLPDARGDEIRPTAPSECDHPDVRVVFPRGGGVARVVGRGGDEEEMETTFVVETLDRDGRVVRATPLEGNGPFYPLAGGRLLATEGAEVVVHDASDEVEARGPATLQDGEAAAPGVAEAGRRLRERGTGATGAEWAAYAVMPGATAWTSMDAARRDPEGVVRYLASVRDAEPERSRARMVFGFLESELRGNGWSHGQTVAPARASNPLAKLPAEFVAEAPAWLKLALATAVIDEDPEKQPAWAEPAIDDAMALGEIPDFSLLPRRIVTTARAEVAMAVDRARFDVRDRSSSALPGRETEDEDAAEAAARGWGESFRVPAGSFAREILACASGAGPSLLRAVVSSLGGPVAMRRMQGLDVDVNEATNRESERDEDAGRIGEALLEGVRSGDSGIRAAAQLISPFAGLGVDAASFRADVLSRPAFGPLALQSLLFEARLPAAAWSSLFTDATAALRSRSADPGTCLTFDTEAVEAEESARADPYCQFLRAFISLSGSERLKSVRAGEIETWSRGASAPVEIRLAGKLARLYSRAATDADVLEILRARDLPAPVRAATLWSLTERNPSPAIRAELERALEGNELSGADSTAYLNVLRHVDPTAARRLAADRWRRGDVPSDPVSHSSTFTGALEPADVTADPLLAAALRKRLDDDELGPEVAALLARTGDPAALPRVVAAIRTGCLRCLGKDRTFAMFAPYAHEGASALADVCRTVPDSDVAATGLDALYDLDAALAAPIAEERLSRSLEGGCVPVAVLDLLSRRGGNPFPEVAARFERLGCDRTRLKASGRSDPNDEKTRENVRAATDGIRSPDCRKAFLKLLGLDGKEGEPAVP